MHFKITDINYTKNTPNISITPNPVDNYAGISINNLLNTSGKIYIFDPSGKVVITENYPMKTNNEFLLINMSNLGSGFIF